jgi:tetratricopeptide (TPR) repeat protein
MIRWQSIVPVIACLLVAQPVSAKDSSGQARAARTACLAGDYAKGVAILSELFVSTEDPVFIYNQGRCFEQNHRYEDAIARFQEFLRVGRKLTKSDKAEVQEHIAACQDQVAKQGGSASGSGSGSGKEAKERAAKKACLLGEVEKGSEILADLFVETNDPTFIYNQGRCFEQNGKNEQAILRFKEYTRKAKGLSAADLDAVRKKIDELQGKAEPVAQQAQPASSAVPLPGRKDDPATAADAKSKNPLALSQSLPPEPAPRPPVYKRWWFWTAAGALVVGGVVTGILLSRKSAPTSPPCDGLGACVP